MVKFFGYGALYGAPRIAISRVISRKNTKIHVKRRFTGHYMIISIMSFPVTDLKCVQLLRYLYGAPYGAPGLQKAK